MCSGYKQVSLWQSVESITSARMRLPAENKTNSPRRKDQTHPQRSPLHLNHFHSLSPHHSARTVTHTSPHSRTYLVDTSVWPLWERSKMLEIWNMMLVNKSPLNHYVDLTVCSLDLPYQRCPSVSHHSESCEIANTIKKHTSVQNLDLDLIRFALLASP